MRPLKTLPAPERLWARIIKGAPNECWPWTSSTNLAGYGYLRVNGKRTQAHRYAYELTKGPIPDGLLIRHTCDNPPCCNPNHLLTGTFADNARDRSERNRHWNQHKTHCPDGHAYDAANTWHDPSGCRRCRTCRNNKLREKRESAMATTTHTITTDDLTGDEGATTRTFALASRTYEIDLTDATWRTLEDILAEYTSAARPVKAKNTKPYTPAASPAKTTNTLTHIRTWARAQNITINDRGRIPTWITDLYHRENPQGAQTAVGGNGTPA